MNWRKLFCQPKHNLATKDIKFQGNNKRAYYFALPPSWFTTNRLSLNLIKTCILPFDLKNFAELDNDNISIDNVPIACI
jgi:hypothetical protein